MIPCKALKSVKRERSISSYFPITHLVSPHIFCMNDFKLGSVFHIKGVPFDTENNEILNRYKKIWYQLILNMGENFGIYTTLHRRKENLKLTGNFSNQFLNKVNQRYHSALGEGSTFVNDIYLTVLTRGLMIKRWFAGLSSRSIEKAYELRLVEQIKTLENFHRQIKVSLSEFGANLLGGVELLNFLGLFLNAGKSIPLSTAYPRMHIANYLSAHRVSFGEAIEFSNQFEIKFAAMVSIKKY